MAPVYMHGDYSLLNKLKKDAEESLVFLLSGTGGATDVFAEAKRRFQNPERKKILPHVVVEHPAELPSRSRGKKQKPNKTVPFVMRQLNTENVNECNILQPPDKIIEDLLLFMNAARVEDDERIGEKENDIKRLREAGYLYCLYKDNSLNYWWWC